MKLLLICWFAVSLVTTVYIFSAVAIGALHNILKAGSTNRAYPLRPAFLDAQYLGTRMHNKAVRRSSSCMDKPLPPSGHYFWRDGKFSGFRVAVEVLAIGMIAGLIACGIHAWTVLLRLQ